jgi:hypothetical protein
MIKHGGGGFSDSSAFLGKERDTDRKGKREARGKGEEIVRAFEKDKIPATVELFDLIMNEQKRQAFRVTLPEGYIPPKEEHKRWARKILPQNVNLPEAGYIGGGFIYSNDDAIKELQKANLPLVGEKSDSNEAAVFGSLYYSLKSGGKNVWYLENKSGATVPLPPFLLEVMSTALAHEVSLKPNTGEAEVTIQLQDPRELGKVGGGAGSPHVDAEGKEISFYVFASSLTTEVYTGTLTPMAREGLLTARGVVSPKVGAEWVKKKGLKKGVRWSSLMPRTLYRFTGDVLHSMPSDKTVERSSDPRLFVHIRF